jgi:pyruvate formate lyase activating enzyme
VYLSIMRHMDFAFNDLKSMNSEKHREYTGLGNEQVLANLRAYANSNCTGRLIVRTPVIEGFNDTEEDFDQIGAFLHDTGLNELNILPFHRLGVTKWEELSMTYAFADSKPTPPDVLEKLRRAAAAHNIQVYVGGETPF